MKTKINKQIIFDYSMTKSIIISGDVGERLPSQREESNQDLV